MQLPKKGAEVPLPKIKEICEQWAVNLVVFDDDLSPAQGKNLEKLLTVVPFGVSDDPPRRTRTALKGVVPGIGADDHVILWGGGVYNWLDPLTRQTPTNRGDGSPDGAFVSCTTAVPCTVGQLSNVTAVKIYVLVRSRDETRGYNDSKTYTLGSTVLGPFNDAFKRHVYVSTIRLPNIAGRRQTP